MMNKKTKGLLALCMLVSVMLTSVCGVNAAPKPKKPAPPPPPAKEKIKIEIHTHHKVPKAQQNINITFIDLSNSHWAYVSVSDLYNRGIIAGFSDNSFRPNDQVTRSQFATMLAKTLSLETKSKSETFKDVPKNRWDFQSVEAAKSYLTGYKKSNGDMFFYGERSAVREDMAVALVKALELQVVSNDKKLKEVFDDYDKISENLRDFVYTAYEEGIMIGSNGQFNPQGSLTRAEAAALLEKVIEKTEKIVIGDYEDEDKVVIGNESDATLSALKYDGQMVEDFDKIDTYYVVKLNNKDIPKVTAKATNSDADVSITQATEVPGYASVVVTSKDKETKKTYTIRFVVEEASSDATLSALKYDNVLVKDFDKDETHYTVNLADDEDIPTVTAVANDDDATVSITQATEIPGYAKIVVVAEDGVTRNIYYVKFTMNKSSDATLRSLKYDNKSVKNFDADTTSYIVELDDDKYIPKVTAVANDDDARLTVTQATYLPGTAKVSVKAEDGTENLYKIHFVLAD